MFAVQLEKFAGPLGALLTMIENEKLDITEITLAGIADQYLAYVKSAPEINPEEVADFLVVAAKLLWLKSKALLPYLSQEEEPELDELAKQLRMYKEFADASLKIADLVAQGNFLFVPEFNRQNRRQLFNLPVFVAPVHLQATDLKSIMLDILRRLAISQPLPTEKLEAKISLDERLVAIRQLLIKQVSFNFRQLINQGASRTEIIVNLLAVLELIKQQELEFEQTELFADIRLSKASSL